MQRGTEDGRQTTQTNNVRLTAKNTAKVLQKKIQGYERNKEEQANKLQQVEFKNKNLEQDLTMLRNKVKEEIASLN